MLYPALFVVEYNGYYTRAKFLFSGLSKLEIILTTLIYLSIYQSISLSIYIYTISFVSMEREDPLSYNFTSRIQTVSLIIIGTKHYGKKGLIQRENKQKKLEQKYHLIRGS